MMACFTIEEKSVRVTQRRPPVKKKAEIPHRHVLRHFFRHDVFMLDRSLTVKSECWHFNRSRDTGAREVSSHVCIPVALTGRPRPPPTRQPQCISVGSGAVIGLGAG